MAAVKAEPIYSALLLKLQGMLESGSPSVVATAEMWGPVVRNHRPTGESTGLPCAACAERWPCKTLVDVARALD